MSDEEEVSCSESSESGYKIGAEMEQVLFQHTVTTICAEYVRKNPETNVKSSLSTCPDNVAAAVVYAEMIRTGVKAYWNDKSRSGK